MAVKKSKYLGKTFGDWSCVHVGVAKASRKYNSNYYYCFARRTSDDEADKIIQVDSKTAAKIYRGDINVEDVLDRREAKSRNNETTFNGVVSYHFYQRT